MIDHRVLVGGAILLLAVVAAVATRRLRFPLLITFLGLGMALGSEGVGGIYFDDAELARTIGIIGLIAILFEGGLTTGWRDVRPVLSPVLVLSTAGVLISAAVTAAAARHLFGFSWPKAFLLGAIIGSTDAAAVFATLRFTTLRRRLATVLAAESGANDPMAVALTLGLIAWVERPGYGLGDITWLLTKQLGLGLAIGTVLGLAASRLLHLLPTELAPFAPVASIGTAAFSYGVAASLHGSGFLAVYVVALWVGNTRMPLRETIVAFHEGLAFLAQVVLFVGARPARLPEPARTGRLVGTRSDGGARLRGPAAGRDRLAVSVSLPGARTALPLLGRLARCGADRARHLRALGRHRGRQHDLQHGVLRRGRIDTGPGDDARAVRAASRPDDRWAASLAV